MNLDTAIIIPARLQSTRLPNKPLIKIGDVYMFLRVYQQAIQSNAGEVFIAGCDKELEEIASSHKCNYIHTDIKIASGTDRVFQAYKKLNKKFRYVINLQGDMPFIDPRTISEVRDLLIKEDCDIVTSATVMREDSEISKSSNVKIVYTGNKALYFTRYPVKMPINYKHIGIYGFQEVALSNFVNLTKSALESWESLEQLRAIESGMEIKFCVVDDPNISIDTKSDLAMAQNYISR